MYVLIYTDIYIWYLLIVSIYLCHNWITAYIIFSSNIDAKEEGFQFIFMSFIYTAYKFNKFNLPLIV